MPAKIKTTLFILVIFISTELTHALQPNEIMIIANGNSKESIYLAEYYCQKRNVPIENIIKLPLANPPRTSIKREFYQKNIAEPVRQKLADPQFKGRIKCLLTTYGVPIRVLGKAVPEKEKPKLANLQKQLISQQAKLKILSLNTPQNITVQKREINLTIKKLKKDIDIISGKQTDASVDSELSMLRFGQYPLYRWQPNFLNTQWLHRKDVNTIMVCRLDAADPKIAAGLIDKAITAETKGLKGIAYFDSREIKVNKTANSYGHFDQSIRDLAMITKFRTQLPVIHEKTPQLFQPGQCPQTAIYCGWYSLRKYIDAFDFVDGAVGYHIASFEAQNLRDPNSTQWCPSMLKDGITATLGAVAEPYLEAFPQPKHFFLELYSGRCLVEAYYRTKPFNSWRMILLGDPLYIPFKKQ